MIFYHFFNIKKFIIIYYFTSYFVTDIRLANSSCYPDFTEHNDFYNFPLDFPLNSTELNFCGSYDEDKYEFMVTPIGNDSLPTIAIMIESTFAQSIQADLIFNNEIHPFQLVSSEVLFFQLEIPGKI